MCWTCALPSEGMMAVEAKQAFDGMIAGVGS